MKIITKVLLLAMSILAVPVHAQNATPHLEGTRAPRRSFFSSHERDTLSGAWEFSPHGVNNYSLQELDPNKALKESVEEEITPFSKRLRRFYEERLSGHSFSSALEGDRTNLSGGVEEVWVRHFASGGAPATDDAIGVAVDAAGNIYVTGYSSGLPHGVDYLTIKYTANGAKVWEARYNGPGNGDDLASALVVDAAGNVYVTGVSFGGSASDDYTTVMYNNAGIEQWVARYNGPGNSFDEAPALAVDVTGNVFVTGRSVGLGVFEDYATIKYSNAGVEQWVARYNGLGTPYDVATAIAVDANGNVCVTGWSREPSASRYTTVKYNSAGVEQWVARYTGPGNGNDSATDLAMDDAGNVYVTGASVGTNSSFDYATIKYNPAGVEQWVARYNGPANSRDEAEALAIDAAGNVYVTGASDGVGTFSDYTTVKYNSAGVEQWAVRYNGSGNSYDDVTDLALDAAGNVYVTGESNGPGGNNDYAAIKYNSAGVQQWESRYSRPGNFLDQPPALAVDAAGNVYLTGQTVGSNTSIDYVTIKHNSFGSIQWVVTYNGSHRHNTDQATALAVDGAGNVCVTGWSSSTSSNLDYLTIKYNSTGVEQWTARYDAGNNIDEPVAIAVDAAGNIYVTGRSRLPGFSTSDYATIKYNSAGVVQWIERYNRSGNDSDVPSALALDAAGNVYVTGSSRASGPDYDYATIKYNSAGMQQWVAHYNGLADSTDLASALKVDAAGNVYVTGQSRGLGTAYDYATIKYNSAGVEQWSARYNGLGNLDDIPTALGIDAAGNVYATGRSNGLGTNTDYATIKYDFAGAQQWTARYNGPANSIDEAAALGVDAAGNVYVTGQSVSATTSFDYVTIKYNTAGLQQWTARYNGLGNSFDFARELALDADGNVYVTGSVGYPKILSPGVFYILSDYGTLKYNSAGVEQWAAFYNGPANDVDEPTALAVDASGNVYVTGYSFGWSKQTWWRIYNTVKYSTPPPAAPTLAAPANGSVDQPTTLTLSWNPAVEAASYHLQVSIGPDFAATVVDDSLLTTTSRQAGPLAHETAHCRQAVILPTSNASLPLPT